LTATTNTEIKNCIQRRHQARAPPWSSSTGSSGHHAPDSVVAFSGMRSELSNEMIMQVVEDRSRSELLAQTQFVAQALTDKQLDLPMLSPKVPLSEILEYRQANEATLLKARDDLAWLAREIESQPLTKDFD
jgi:hypothetical protein